MTQKRKLFTKYLKKINEMGEKNVFTNDRMKVVYTPIVETYIQGNEKRRNTTMNNGQPTITD